jgi:hypothetical protein
VHQRPDRRLCGALDDFKFANDGDGGSIVCGQTGASQSSLFNGNAAPIQLAGNTAAGQDTFVFASNFGQVTISKFAPKTDTIAISKTVCANIGALGCSP